MMQFAHPHLSDIADLEFYRLMGSGKDFGFNPLPDWSTYALLTVWKNEHSANEFFKHSELFSKYKKRAVKIDTYYMRCIKSHGLWSGTNPFEIHDSSTGSDYKIAVITRATIKKKHLFRFWNYVPESTKALISNPDLIYTKGIGEVPIIQMATFSVWRNMDAILAFAYRDSHHKKAVSMTKQYDWYSEEMFSRFEIFKLIDLMKS